MGKFAAALFFFCSLLAGQGLLWAEELCLTYDVKVAQAIEKGGGKKEEKEHHFRAVVGLGEGYFYFTDTDGKKIYDLKKKRIIYVDDPGRTLSDVSLFSDVGYRVQEFQNRLNAHDAILKTAVKSKKPQMPVESVFDIESFFSIETPGAQTQEVIETLLKGRFTYGVDQKTVAECEFSDWILRGDQKALLDKYLIYDCHFHPQVRARIVERDRAPQYLRYDYRDSERTVSVEMTLVKATQEARASYEMPEGYQKLYGPPGEELNAIIAGVMEGKNPAQRLRKEDFIQLIDELTAKKEYFDAALTVLECGLQTGEDLPEKMRQVMSAGGAKDERLKKFLENLVSKDKPSAEKAAKALGKIKRKGLTRGYVIDVMIANNKVKAGDITKARELFLKVLKTNPRMAGVYTELGGLLSRSYYLVSAWQCWDTARFLYPGHKMLKPVNGYEAWLQKTFPDFFLNPAARNT